MLVCHESNGVAYMLDEKKIKFLCKRDGKEMKCKCGMYSVYYRCEMCKNSMSIEDRRKVIQALNNLENDDLLCEGIEGMTGNMSYTIVEYNQSFLVVEVMKKKRKERKTWY